MQISLDYSPPWLVIFSLLLVAILAIQLTMILRKKTLSNQRKGIRLGLNILFLISLMLLIFQPYFNRAHTSEAVIVYEPEVAQQFIDHLQDSLGTDKSIPIAEYKGQFDDIHLVGQNFDPIQLGKLQGNTINWIPKFKNNELRAINWKGLVRMGEAQTIRGMFYTNEDVLMSLYYGDELVDSVMVGPYQHSFQLMTQAKAIGRNSFTLLSDGASLGAINFYALENQPINYLMRFSYPDMETRRLSEWLGSRGEGIKTNIQYSTDIQQRASTLATQDTTQFFITEPQFANSAEIKDAIASGATILFTNLGAPDKELLQINRALGSNFSLNRATQEGSRNIAGTLTALPYTFITQANQWELLDNAVAYQKVGRSKVGISLLEATFPLAMQGDSIAYAAVWEEILSSMRPSEGTSFQVSQPIFLGLAADEWQLNTLVEVDDMVRTEEDSIYLTRSAVNPSTHRGIWKAGQEGWLSFADSLETFVYGQEEFELVRQNGLLSHFLQSQKESIEQTQPHQYKVEISDWWYFALLVFTAAMLWAEPRVPKLS